MRSSSKTTNDPDQAWDAHVARYVGTPYHEKLTPTAAETFRAGWDAKEASMRERGSRLPSDEWVTENLEDYKACRSHREITAIQSMLAQVLATRDEALARLRTWLMMEIGSAGHEERLRFVTAVEIIDAAMTPSRAGDPGGQG